MGLLWYGLGLWLDQEIGRIVDRQYDSQYQID